MIWWIKGVFCILGSITIFGLITSCCSREERITKILKDLEVKKLRDKVDKAIEKEMERKGE